MTRGYAGLLLGLLCLFLGACASTPPQPQGTADDVMIRTYRQAIALSPNDVIAHFNLGLALYKSERWDEAREVLNKCVTLNRGDNRGHQQVDGPAYQLLGIIYYNHLHDDRKAVEAFQQSLKLLPNDTDTYYALGLAELRCKEYNDALKAFDQAIALGRNQDADIYFQRGLAFSEIQKENEAIASYEEALKRKPEYLAALENLALIYHRRQDDNHAIAVLERLVKLDPSNFNANYLLGLHYFRKKMYSEMVAAYNRAVAVNPNLADAHYNLGMAYFYQTRYDLAVEELKKAIALNPKDAEAFNLLGQAQTAAIENYLRQGGTHLAQEKYALAIEELQKVFTIDPNHAKAKELLEDARRRMREEFALHLHQGDKLFSRNKLDEAYAEYELAASLNPESAEAKAGMQKSKMQLDKLLAQLMKKAKAAEQMKDFQEAYAQYAAVLALKAEYAPAKTALGLLRQNLLQELRQLGSQAGREVEKDKLLEASIHYKKALKLAEALKDENEQEKILAGLTRVNARKADLIRQYLADGKKNLAGNDAKRAKENFNAVLKLDPQNKTANEFIVKLTGSQSQAKVTDEQIKTTYYRGVDHYVNGKIEEAIQEWEKVVELDPENQDARINISRAKAKLAAIRKLTEGY